MILGAQSTTEKSTKERCDIFGSWYNYRMRQKNGREMLSSEHVNGMHMYRYLHLKKQISKETTTVDLSKRESE